MARQARAAVAGVEELIGQAMVLGHVRADEPQDVVVFAADLEAFGDFGDGVDGLFETAEFGLFVRLSVASAITVTLRQMGSSSILALYDRSTPAFSSLRTRCRQDEADRCTRSARS